MSRITAIILAALFVTLPIHATAAEEGNLVSVADLYKGKDALNGQQVTLSGKVVKVNNRIMGRNFLHLQDGTGSAEDGSNDITVTSQDTANVGDQVTITGTLVLDHDFGGGYSYPLLIEKASVTAGN
jgi:hypothetical protein